MTPRIPTYYGEPSHWSGAHGSKPTPAPVYGKAMDRSGNSLELDADVIVHPRYGSAARRAKVVAIGDYGHPGMNIVRIREHGSAYITTCQSEDCEPHCFDDYDWLKAEEAAAVVMDKRGIDLARCMFGGFWFDQYQREVAKVYMANRFEAAA